ncbi:MAG: PQQ-binding-like beta-propeller repeat protein [Pirellulaceae bacterium]
MRIFRIEFTLLVLTALLGSLGTADESDRKLASAQWSHWRGPLLTGEAPAANPPVTWSETENLAWKTAIPGKGHSSPVVWDDRIFLTTAEPFGEELDPRYSQAPGAHDNLPVTHRQRFRVLAIDRTSGKIVWNTVVKEALPHEAGHFTGSLASASPTTDGQRVYASFGSYGIFALSWNGEILWQKSLGTMQSKHGHGEGSSPLLANGKLIVNWDHEGKSFVVALNATDGRELWRTKRPEVTSWASPIAVTLDGKTQVVVSGTTRIRGYDVETGQVIWECGGLSANVVASPVFHDGILYAASSYEIRSILAMNIQGARGDITGTDRVLWTKDRSTPYVPSPLLYRNSLYYLRHYQGILSKVNAQTGDDAPGPFRLNGIRDIYASPVAADGRIYVSDLDGNTLVISADPIPRPLQANSLGEPIAARPRHSLDAI